MDSCILIPDDPFEVYSTKPIIEELNLCQNTPLSWTISKIKVLCWQKLKW